MLGVFLEDLGDISEIPGVELNNLRDARVDVLVHSDKTRDTVRSMLSYKQEMILGFATLVVLFTLVLSFIWKYRQNMQVPPSSEPNLIADQPTPSQPRQLTLSQVQEHNAQTNCWLIIDQKVYEVTDYISSHPGGAKRIVTYCGQDATQAFATQGGQGFHSTLAKRLLQKYQIGELAAQ